MISTDKQCLAHLHYRVYGQRVCSNCLLPELQGARFDTRDIEFREVSSDLVTSDLSTQTKLVTKKTTNLGTNLLVYMNADGYLIDWEDKCLFQISLDGRTIRYSPKADVEHEWITSAFYGVVLSFALHLEGIGNLHASGVVLPGGVVGFLAEPGTGKSSIAASFGRAGYPVLTDDVLAFKEENAAATAFPGFPYVSLSPNAVKHIAPKYSEVFDHSMEGDKKRIAVDGCWASFQSTPSILSDLIILSRSHARSRISLRKLEKSEAFLHLLRNTTCLPLLTPELIHDHMAILSGLVSKVNVWKLAFPSGWEHVEFLIDTVVKTLKSTHLDSE